VLRLVGVLGLTLLLLLAACGGDDDDDAGDDGSGNGATATEATDGGDDGGDQTDAPEDTEDSGDDDDDGGDSGFHACDLMTSEEVSAIVGAEVGEGRDYLATGPGATQCEWASEDSSTVVYIEAMTEGGPDWYEAIHFPSGDPGDTEEVDGVGDEATWDTFLDSLDAIEGDKFVAVQPLLFFSEADDKTVAIELAKLALERVP